MSNSYCVQIRLSNPNAYMNHSDVEPTRWETIEDVVGHQLETTKLTREIETTDATGAVMRTYKITKYTNPNTMVFYLKNGGVRVLRNWNQYDIMLGSDWKNFVTTNTSPFSA